MGRPRGASTPDRERWRRVYQENKARKRWEGRQYYQRHREERLEYAASYLSSRGHPRNNSRNMFTRHHRQWMHACVVIYKRMAGCMDCRVDDPRVLDFDHRPGTAKDFTIGDFARDVGVARLWGEIQKCDVVCANCHRLRTWGRCYENLEDWYNCLRT